MTVKLLTEQHLEFLSLKEGCTGSSESILVKMPQLIFVLSCCFSVRETKYRMTLIQPRLFVCFVALRPKSTAMVIAGRSVHLTTLFPGQA